MFVLCMELTLFVVDPVEDVLEVRDLREVRGKIAEQALIEPGDAFTGELAFNQLVMGIVGVHQLGI